jgi:alkaline phosphatase D
VPLTSLLGEPTKKDSWTAFASEKASLLDALHSVPNVIVLSGDRHEFAAVEYNSEVSHNTVTELSTSPLSNFYVPFWRSLRRRTAETIKRTKTEVKIAEDGLEDIVTTVEELPKERMFKYIVLGNYKWSVSMVID